MLLQTVPYLYCFYTVFVFRFTVKLREEKSGRKVSCFSIFKNSFDSFLCSSEAQQEHHRHLRTTAIILSVPKCPLYKHEHCKGEADGTLI